MPEALQAALETAGLAPLVMIALLAGVVYGFAGFGSALIFMPLAVIFIAPAHAIAAFSVSAFASLITVVPKALPLVNKRAVGTLIVTATLSASLGIWVLKVADVTLIRWVVVVVAGVTLAALISGWRYQMVPTDLTRSLVGTATGFVGGMSGLMGPIMVMFQLAGQDAAAVTRATTAVFLTTTSVLVLPLMYLQELLPAASVALGIILLLPYGLGTYIGQRLFDPACERLYRTVAYAIIGGATFMGLPLWDKM